MKYITLFFLTLTNFIWTAEKKVENKELCALTGFQKFEVIALISPYEKIDQSVLYNSMIESFKKMGQVSVSEHESMFSSLLQSDIACPICCFSFGKDQDKIDVSLQVFAEVEVMANKHKTACPIWKKTLIAPIPEDTNQTDAAIASLAQEMIKNFAEDYMKANAAGTKQLSFQVQKFKGF